MTRTETWGLARQPPGSYLISALDMSQSQPSGRCSQAVAEEKKIQFLYTSKRLVKFFKKINLHFSPYF